MSSMPPTEALPILSERPRGREMISSLAIGAYRTYLLALVGANMSVWVMRIAQDWVVLQLTGDVALVGMLVLLQFGPMLLFGMWGGLIADRFDTRFLLLLAQTAGLVVSATLTVLAMTGHLSAGAIFAGAFVIGIVGPVEQPARQIYIVEIVGLAQLRNAISVRETLIQITMMVGPALGGLLLPFGDRWAFLAATVLAVVALVAILLSRAPAAAAHPQRSASQGQIRQALRYCRRKPDIFWTLLLLVFISTLGLNWPVLLAGMAARVFDSGATGYGLYMAAVGAGSLVGALLSLRRRTVTLRAVYVAAMLFSGMKLLSGLAPEQLSFLGLIATAGLGGVLMWTAANVLLQASSNAAIRGRVMSLYLLIAFGGQAIGGPVLGLVVEGFGARWGLLVSGGVPLLAAVVLFLLQAQGRRRRERRAIEDPSAGG